MNLEYLDKIEVNFPRGDQLFVEYLLKFLRVEHEVSQSRNDLFPKIFINEFDKKNLTVNFCTNRECLTIEILNYTDIQKKSEHTYKHLELNDVINRLGSEIKLEIDHLGVNLPWFEKEPHPLISDLRSKLKDKSLYYLFPTGENWDFIIPGTKEEILDRTKIDRKLERRAKFELVSFESSSTPILQIDVDINLEYVEIKKLFPEAINLDKIKSSWIYLKTNFYFDICLVLNERSGDWSNFIMDKDLS